MMKSVHGDRQAYCDCADIDDTVLQFYNLFLLSLGASGVSAGQLSMNRALTCAYLALRHCFEFAIMLVGQQVDYYNS